MCDENEAVVTEEEIPVTPEVIEPCVDIETDGEQIAETMETSEI